MPRAGFEPAAYPLGDRIHLLAGRVEVENKLKSGMNCVSGPVKFKAKAGG